MKYFILSCAIFLVLEANEIKQEPREETSSWLLLDKGLKKDFYINEYLKTNITKEESLNALSLVDNLTHKMFYNFAEKFKHDETLGVAQCMQMETKELLTSYSDCILNGLSLAESTTLSALEIDSIIEKTSSKYPNFSKKLKTISSSIPFTKLIILKKDDFYDVYLNVSEPFRERYFNYRLPKRTFTKIFEDKNKFNEFIQVSLTNPKLTQVHKSLLEIDDSKLSANSSFLLALNAIRLKNTTIANTYLNNSLNKSPNSYFTDKIKFWQYQVTKNENILEELSLSLNINMYTVYANEFLNKPFDDLNLETFELFDIYLKDYDISRVALLYSIAKVKSLFDASKISKDFNLGIMQLDSTFVKSISNNLAQDFNILDQLKIETSLSFANIHLNSFQSLADNIFYRYLAYNGNTLLLNKILNNKDFFKSKVYEPYLVLEFLSNNNKEEIKDILVYYFLYYNKLVEKKEDKIRFLSIFETLITPVQKLDE